MKAEIVFSKEHAEFLTVTCFEWKQIFAEDRFKDIITQSLNYLGKSKPFYVYGFAIMLNHFLLIWQMVGDHNGQMCKGIF